MRLVYAFLSLLSVVHAAQKGPLKFNVIGDWGVGNHFVAPDNKDFKPIHVQAGLTNAQFGHLLSRTEGAVTEAFQTVSDYFHPQFVISTGDQFYDDGLVSRNDTQFKTKFSDVFNHPSVNVTWYPTLGNHDYYINPDNQLNKASDDWRWYFPARNYSFSQYLEDGSEVLFVVMDVNPALLKYRAEKELFPGGKYVDKQIVQLLQAARSSWPGQLTWAEQLLTATNAKWKIVIGHQPIYSSDGVNAFSELQEALQPILERTNVSVYFSGHYHTLEITEVNGINYVISGAAAQVPYPIGNLTAAALTEYFQQHPLNMSLYPTTPPTPSGPTPTYGPTVYPADPKAKPVAIPQIVHFKGGYEAWLPGFMTVELTEKTMNILIWGMGNDTTWSVVKQHDILRKDLQKPHVVARPLKFNVIGDWGVGNRFIPGDSKDFGDIHKKAGLTLQQYGQLLYLTELSVSKQFQDVSDAFEPDFIISTGDQFYDDGLLTRDDPQFKTKFQDVYTRQSVKVPWYPVLGNHDYYIDPDTQINRTDDPRWVFPARNYTYSWFMEDGSEVLFVCMDVNPGLVKYRAEKELDPVKGKYKDKRIVQLLQAAKVTWPAQLEWAEETLRQSRATWKIVVGHQPIYSSSGAESFTELQRDVQPILERQNVSVYFGGHYHTLEIVETNAVQYIISGAASQVPYPIGNLTSAALIDYFAAHPVNMSEYPTTVAPTGSPTYGPTIYPAETAPPQGKPAQITHFAGGNQLWLPGFMTCTLNLTHMHVEIWGLGNDTLWSIVKRHDVLRRDLRPANMVHKELKFNVIGDWGVGKNFVAPDSKDFKAIHVQANLTTVQFGHLLSRTETAVVSAFQSVSDSFHPHFVLSTGDQFYDDGLVSRDDPQFKTKFSDVFNRSSVNVTWYPTLGNHDYYMNPDNELNKYTDDWRWHFPARNYSFSWFIDDGTEVLFVVMDVNPALLKYRAEKELFPGGKYVDKKIVQLLQAAKSTWPGQLAWAEQTLTATKAKWKIVMGHEPIYSSDGENAFTELQLSLQPILERTNVSVYFSGHYHTLEITEVNGINYVISGAAAQVPYPIGNVTAAALTEYFQQNPLDMSMYPTISSPTGPTPTYGPTIYPVDPKVAPPAKPKIIHSTGGYEAWLPGFMTCSLNATHLHIDTWGMNNDTVWIIWNRHDIIRKDLRPAVAPTNAPTTTQPPTNSPATTQPPSTSISNNSSSSSSSSPRGNSTSTTTSPPTTPSNTTSSPPSSTGVASSSSSSTGVIPNGAITITPIAFICGCITFITMLFA